MQKISLIINTLLISLATFLAGVSLSIINPFYPTEALSKGVTVSQTGLVLSSVFPATVVLTPVCGQYMHTLAGGAKTSLVLGSLIVGAASAGFGCLEAVHSGPAFLALSLALRLVTAAGESCTAPAATTLASTQLGGGRGIAVTETCYGLGTMLGPAMGGLLYDAGGFVAPFAVTGGLTVTAALLCALLLTDPPLASTGRRGEGGAESRAVSWGEVVTARGVGVSVASLVVAGCGWAWYSASLEPFLKQQYGLTASHTGLVFMVFGLAYTVSTPVVGVLTDWGMDGFRAMIIGNFGIFLGFVLLGPIPPLQFMGSLELCVTGLAIQGIGSSFTYIGTLLCMMDSVFASGLPDKEQTRAMVSSLWVISDCIGGYLGTSLGSLAFDNLGFAASTMVMAAVTLSSVLVTCVYMAGTRSTAELGDTAASSSQETQRLLGGGQVERKTNQDRAEENCGNYVC